MIRAAQQWLKPYWFKEARVMLVLGFASGLPLLLVFGTLSVWLREAGIARSTIGFISWAALSYGFKFIWAPIVDSLNIPLLGRYLGKRRSWLCAAQCAILLALALMVVSDPAASQANLMFVTAGAILLGFASATQDIVIDAYRIEIAPPEQQSLLAGVYIVGYRVGMLVAGAGALEVSGIFTPDREMGQVLWQFYHSVTGSVIGTVSLDAPASLGHSLSASIDQLAYHIGASSMGMTLLDVASVASPKQYQFLSWQLAYGAMAIVMCCLIVFTLYLQEPKHSREPSPYQHQSLRIFIHFALMVSTFITIYTLYGQVPWLANAFNYMADLALSRVPFAAYLFDSWGITSNITGSIYAFVQMLSALALALWMGSILAKTPCLPMPLYRSIYIVPFKDFFVRYGLVAVAFILIICLYRISDIVMGVMAKTFYVDMGYTKQQIGRISVTFGLFVTIAGGLLGGILAIRYGILKVFMAGAISSALSNIIFVYLAGLSGPSETALILAIIADNLAGGLAGAASIAFISSLINTKYSATQYAAFSSLIVLLPKLAGGYSGTLVDNLGYETFFTITAFMGVPVVLLIILIWKPYHRIISNASKG